MSNFLSHGTSLGRILLSSITLAILAGSCSSDSIDSEFVSVEIQAAGLGAGFVADANEPGVSIGCMAAVGQTAGRCASEFAEPEDGAISLVASPNIGSQFGGWTNCSSSSGMRCDLSVTAGDDIVVTAQFTLDQANACNGMFSGAKDYILCAETSNSCTFYRRDLAGDGMTCDQICSTAGAVCLGAQAEAADLSCETDPNEPMTCSTMAHDALCECSL